MRWHWQIPRILTLDIAMFLPPDEQSHRHSPVVMVIIGEKVVVVIVI
jgi:hypothetical protein